jgi:pseudouridine kinase
MPSREQQILALLRDDPMLPQQVIAERLGISRSAVAGHIMSLTDKGIIKGRGYVLAEAPFVVVIGGANIDIHGKSDAALRARDSNPGSVLMSAGGVGRNIAENLARLGADARLISAIGNDQHGDVLMRLSREAGIDTQHVLQLASAPTSTYLSVLDATGDMRVAINDMRIIDELTAERLNPHRAMLGQAALLVLDTNLPDDALAWLTTTLSDRPIFVDTVSVAKARKITPYLGAIHTLKMSASEASAVTDLEAHTKPQLARVAAQLHDAGVGRVFITCGAQGVFFSADGEQGTLAAAKRRAANTGGAGDAFLAALAYAWIEGWSLADTLPFALTAAELTITDAATSSPALSLKAINQAMGARNAG